MFILSNRIVKRREREGATQQTQAASIHFTDFCEIILQPFTQIWLAALAENGGIICRLALNVILLSGLNELM